MDVTTPGREPIDGARTSDLEPGAGSPAAAEELTAERFVPAATPEAAEAAAEGEGTEAARRYKERWLRAEADLQNFRRRATRDTEEARRFATERGLLATIEQLDDLERALDAAREAGAAESWTTGVEFVAQRMRDHLARHGAIEIAAAGTPFDPAMHEALLEVDAPEGVTPGHVVQVVRKGYRAGDRVLRPARVIVARRAD